MCLQFFKCFILSALRLTLVRVLETMAEEATFSRAWGMVTDPDHSGVLVGPFTDYIDGARLYLETAEAIEGVSAKDAVSVQSSIREIKIHFSAFIGQLIRSFPCKYTL